MVVVEALNIALAKEKASIQLYQRFAQQYPEIKDLVLSLLIEEEKHKKLIESKITALTQ